MRFIPQTLLAITLLLIPLPANALIVGTFNIRYDSQADAQRGDGWERRAPVVAGLIRFHNFDVLGTQEGLLNQVRDLQKLMPEYAHTGRGRDDGKDAGEHVAIFYKKDKFRLLDGGDFWLSETAAIRYALNGTFNSFNPNTKTESRIDHVFLTKHFKPLRYGVLTDSYRSPVAEAGVDARDAPNEVKLQEFQARLPSDHFPVLVEVEF